MLHSSLAIIAGLLSVPLTEIFTVTWLRNAPADLDLTANFFSSVVFPVVLSIHLLMMLTFWKALARNPVRNCLLYVATHAVALSLMLNLFGNPLGDIAIYVGIICLSGLLISAVFRRYLWTTARNGI